MADAQSEIQLHETLEKREIFPSDKADVCRLCTKQFAKYTCPRCNIHYCSTTCYRSEKHLQCSEAFYKESVLEELKLDQGNPRDAKNVMEMLKRLEDEEKPGEVNTDISSIEQRIENVNLDEDPDALWEALTKEEQQEFERAVGSGQLADLITLWSPWWKAGNLKSGSVVEVLANTENDSENEKESVNLDEKPKTNTTNSGDEVEELQKSKPPIVRNVPSLGSVIKKTKPNPVIQYSIVNVLYAYAYTMRLYNGTPDDNPEHAPQDLLTLSSVLSKNLTFESIESVVHNSLGIVLEQKEAYNSQPFSHAVLLDIIDLVNGYYFQGRKKVYFVDCALSDTHRLLEKGIKILKEDNKELEKSLWLAKKKVDFFLAWTQQNVEVLQSLAPHIKALYYELNAAWKLHDSEKRGLQKEWKGPKPKLRTPLIEEL